MLYGGEEWEYRADVHAGDTITAETRLASLAEKSGGSGPFVLVTTETTYTNQNGRGRRDRAGATDRPMSDRFVEDVKPGDLLPPLVKNASRAQLFLFSAATHNPHRIHYDRDYARVEGHEDILVHGPLQGAWLHQFVLDWAGPRGRVLALGFQNRGRAFPGQDLTFRGRVTGVEGDVVTLEVREENGTGAVLMPATARVRLPRRSGAAEPLSAPAGAPRRPTTWRAWRSTSLPAPAPT